VANSDDKHGVSLVLEDDIDMEQDIRQRLASVWSALPHTWDIVFLGE
jgi:GR25 family glycosyltransferase involved in LPS biosynthesis